MEAIKGILSSKKAVVTITAILVIAGVKLGLPEEAAVFVADRVVVVVTGYLASQGLADFGKGKFQLSNLQDKTEAEIKAGADTEAPDKINGPQS